MIGDDKGKAVATGDTSWVKRAESKWSVIDPIQERERDLLGGKKGVHGFWSFDFIGLRRKR